MFFRPHPPLRILILTATATLVIQGHAQVLAVNLGRATTPSETGFTNWTTNDNTAPSATTISGIGLSVDISVSDSGSGTALRSVDRSDGLYTGTLDALTDNWWGARAGTIGQPGGGQFSIIIDGSDLGAGTFEWTSWHFDHDNQTGLMDIEYSVDGGSTFSTAFDDFDIVDGDVDLFAGAPNPATFQFTSDGTNDVWIRFTNDLSNGGGDGTENFVVVNGFRIESASAPTPDPEITSFSVSGSSATVVMTGAPGTDYYCAGSPDLTDWTTEVVPTDTSGSPFQTDVNGDLTFTVDTSSLGSSYFFRIQDSDPSP